MIEIVEGSDTVAHRDLMDALFRRRYEDFVVRRNWALPCSGGRDVDQYDDHSATYFVALADDGKSILASSRINQTSRASLLADLFPHLIENGAAARAPTLYEGTRFSVDASLRTRAQVRGVRANLCITACRWMMQQGGTHMQAVVEMSAFRSFLDMSLGTKAMGLPHDYGGGPSVRGGGRCIAFRWDLQPSLLDDFAAYGGLDEQAEERLGLHPLKENDHVQDCAEDPAR